MRLLLLFCATVLEAQQPFVQTPAQTLSRLDQPSVDLARQWIHDSVPLHRAWAAKLSSRISDPSFDAELIGALGDAGQFQSIPPLTTKDGPDFDKHRARLAILDALIQRGSRVPEEAGLALLPEYPGEAIILLYRG